VANPDVGLVDLGSALFVHNAASISGTGGRSIMNIGRAFSEFLRNCPRFGMVPTSSNHDPKTLRMALR